MTKEEKIQEAYGEYWAELKQYVNMDNGIAEVPSSINRTEYLNKFKFIANYPSVDGFKQMLIPQSIEMISYNNGWTKVEDILPDEGIEVLCFNEAWIDEDFNPKGVRIGFLNGDGWITAHWWNYQDTYMTISHSECDDNDEFGGHIRDNIDPTHYMLFSNKPPIY